MSFYKVIPQPESPQSQVQAPPQSPQSNEKKKSSPKRENSKKIIPMERLISLQPLKPGESRPFPKYGISLEGIYQFIEIIGGKNRISDLTTSQICEKFLKPMTKRYEVSYCDYLRIERKGGNIIGEANIFISHAWGYNFLDVVEAIEICKLPIPDGAATIYLWLDLFTNNQHGLQEPPPFEWWCDTFMEAIRRMNHVVMVLSPWDNPYPLRRAWCLWELYCAVKTASDFQIAMCRREQQRFEEMICDKTIAFYGLLGNVDLRNSEATNPKDKERIFEVVQRTYGLGPLNELITAKLREWVLEKMELLCESLEYADMEAPPIDDFSNNIDSSTNMKKTDCDNDEERLLENHRENTDTLEDAVPSFHSSMTNDHQLPSSRSSKTVTNKLLSYQLTHADLLAMNQKLPEAFDLLNSIQRSFEGLKVTMAVDDAALFQAQWSIVTGESLSVNYSVSTLTKHRTLCDMINQAFVSEQILAVLLLPMKVFEEMMGHYQKGIDALAILLRRIDQPQPGELLCHLRRETVVSWYLRGILGKCSTLNRYKELSLKEGLQCYQLCGKYSYPSSSHNNYDDEKQEINSMELLKSMMVLAKCYSFHWQPEKALDLYLKLYSSLQNNALLQFSNSHPFLLQIMKEIGDLYLQFGYFHKSLAYYEQCHSLSLEKFGPENALVQTLQGNIMNVQAHLGSCIPYLRVGCFMHFSFPNEQMLLIYGFIDGQIKIIQYCYEKVFKENHPQTHCYFIFLVLYLLFDIMSLVLILLVLSPMLLLMGIYLLVPIVTLQCLRCFCPQYLRIRCLYLDRDRRIYSFFSSLINLLSGLYGLVIAALVIPLLTVISILGCFSCFMDNNLNICAPFVDIDDD